MTSTIRIAPSILAIDFTRMGEQLRAADVAGADLFHFDVMDGRFVPNISIGVPVLKAARSVTKTFMDVHLMIVEPDHLLPAFAEAGADAINVHVETCPNLHRTLQHIHQLGCKAGVALNPHTPAAALTEIISVVDRILVMTVNPGFGGQAFLPETLPKIRQLRAMIDQSGREIALAVDGGIQEETARLVGAAGADVLIAGTAIFSDEPRMAETIRALRQAAASGN